MLERCYSKEFHKTHPTYKDCEVCEEWLNFQNFATWYIDNYYVVENQTMCLDKDILYKGNKIYSPDTCIFVPQEINTLFVKRNKSRGKYPIGVYYSKEKNKYRSMLGKTHLGYFDTPEGAFNVYKKAKERHIKEIADKYKCDIPKKLYEAMYEYKVDIID